MEGVGIERNLRLQTGWYAVWYTAEPPRLYEGHIRVCSGHQLDSGHPPVPKTQRLWGV